MELNGLRVAADVADAELRIALGMVTSNPFMLWDGAWSGVAPGLLGGDSLSEFLRSAGSPAEATLQPSMLAESRAVESKLEFEFELNLLSGTPSVKQSVFAGKPSLVHKEIDRYLAGARLLEVKEQADVIILSPGGAPLDRTLFSALDSALVHPEMTRRGGAIVLVAACEEAYGPDEFYNLMRSTSSASDLTRRYGRKPDIVTLKTLLVSRVLSQNTIVLISTLPDYYVHHVFGLRSSKTAGGGLLAAERAVEKLNRVVVIRHGSAFASRAATRHPEN
jgi:nickel-dependent lactate racemase